jgi:hypothetical protein
MTSRVVVMGFTALPWSGEINSDEGLVRNRPEAGGRTFYRAAQRSAGVARGRRLDPRLRLGRGRERPSGLGERKGERQGERKGERKGERHDGFA